MRTRMQFEYCKRSFLYAGTFKCHEDCLKVPFTAFKKRIMRQGEKPGGFRFGFSNLNVFLRLMDFTTDFMSLFVK